MFEKQITLFTLYSSSSVVVLDYRSIGVLQNMDRKCKCENWYGTKYDGITSNRNQFCSRLKLESHIQSLRSLYFSWLRVCFSWTVPWKSIHLQRFILFYLSFILHFHSFTALLRWFRLGLVLLGDLLSASLPLCFSPQLLKYWRGMRKQGEKH